MSGDTNAKEILEFIKSEREYLIKHNKMKRIKELPEIASRDIPYKLPKNWIWCHLGDISANSDFSFADGPFGSDLKVEHYTKKPEVRLIQLGNIGDGVWKDKSVIYTTFEKADSMIRCNAKSGDLVIAKMMPAGKATILPNINTRYILSSDVVKFVPHSMILPKYINYLTCSLYFRNSVTNDLRGTTRQRTSVEKLRRVIVPLPPLSEQKQIVVTIDNIFEKLDEIKEITEKQLVDVIELYQSNTDNIVNQLIEKYVCKSMKEITTRIGDGIHGTPEYDSEGEYYFINGNNLHQGIISLTEDTKRVSKEEYELHKRELTENTFLYSINGSIGNYAYYQNEKIILGKSAAYFNLINDVMREYVVFIFQSSYVKKSFKKRISKLTIDNLSLAALRELQIPVPPIEVQKTIVNNFRNQEIKITTLKETISRKLTYIEELRKSILDKAFRGELIR